MDWGCGWPSSRMRFENLTCVHSHGLTLGSEMSGGIEDILFKNISVGQAFAAKLVDTQAPPCIENSQI